MLGTECARVLGYGDSHSLFAENRSLYKIIANQADEDDLARQGILSLSHSSKQTAIITARSMFRQFGSRIIRSGKRVRDDYWENIALQQVTSENILAAAKIPGRAREGVASVLPLREVPQDVLRSIQEDSTRPAGSCAALGTEMDGLRKRFHGQKMNDIYRLICTVLRRSRTTLAQQTDDNLFASFRTGWNLRAYFLDNYDAGIEQNIDRILTLTEKESLLNAIQDAINPFAVARSVAGIEIDPTLQIINVRGSESFIISVAQQLCWLRATLHDRPKTLMFGDVDLSEDLHNIPHGPPTFCVNVRLLPIAQKEHASCWNSLVGSAIIVIGFPIRDREPIEKGLDIAVAAMATLADTPRAVSFQGGWVFKGQWHALVPTAISKASIQWHLIDTYPQVLSWDDIDELCPDRLRTTIFGVGRMETQQRSFLGWCSEVEELLGTPQFDHKSVQYSQAETPSRYLQVEKSQTRVPNKCRGHHLKRSSASEGPAVREGGVNDLCFAHSNRQLVSTHDAMLKNADKVFALRHQFSSEGARRHFFKDEVKSIFATLDGLWANDNAGSKTSFKIPFSYKEVSGWEYMNVVKDIHYFGSKSIEFQKAREPWDGYARDIKALVLFGSNFGDVLRPAPQTVCQSCVSLPGDQYYLAMRVEAVQHLLDREGSQQNQLRLTPSGLTLASTNDPFGPCSVDTPCSSIRTVQFVKRASREKAHCALKLASNGAVIIGEGERGFRSVRLFGKR
ncbi:hypothetical protein NPX13_g4272 [Xylaria arbuscula]|uniref:Uncharacterized protein n=1 Tax=Xylaria arbuscula TaxID=114810 RepID=A0A9W8TM33_9PEZI|nr:hypothetical protein NPX13_g4272 [Xylaria arbuscula]